MKFVVIVRSGGHTQRKPIKLFISAVRQCPLCHAIEMSFNVEKETLNFHRSILFCCFVLFCFVFVCLGSVFRCHYFPVFSHGSQGMC